MQNEQIIQDVEMTGVIRSFRKHTPFLQLAGARTHHRRVRIAFSLPRRESCVTKRALLAALREAEYAEWMASGGDYISSMHQPIG
jgi:hypothetical protein